ncbi:preprotein translocase subunit SecE [Buchnera aphidicola]|uniref:preprotein translocase subunit SecE n=1 Tax=Buchnera aphidicola TaxID=9 RepID=UPI00346391F8
MNIKIYNKKNIFLKKNIIKYILFFCINIMIYIIYKEHKYNIKNFSLILLTIISIMFLLQKKMKKIITSLEEIQLETKNIHWSNVIETIQITIIIFISSAIISLILWILDRISFYIISSIINLRIL